MSGTLLPHTCGQLHIFLKPGLYAQVMKFILLLDNVATQVQHLDNTAMYGQVCFY